MGTFDFLYVTNTPKDSLEAERARANAAVRRCAELRAELAKAKLALKLVRCELETLRRCIKGE
jgi:radical SAM superfamily enzyme with C-terminal helix-hairpin-helix motif